METSKIFQNTIQETELPVIMKKDNVETNYIDFKKIDQYYLLKINLQNIIKKDNYKLYLNGSYLYLILFERRDLAPPMHIHNMNWNNLFYQEYEIMKSIDIRLPKDNFYLIEHYIDADNLYLKVFLGVVPKKQIYTKS